MGQAKHMGNATSTRLPGAESFRSGWQALVASLGTGMENAGGADRAPEHGVSGVAEAVTGAENGAEKGAAGGASSTAGMAKESGAEVSAFDSATALSAMTTARGEGNQSKGVTLPGEATPQSQIGASRNARPQTNAWTTAVPGSRVNIGAARAVLAMPRRRPQPAKATSIPGSEESSAGAQRAPAVKDAQPTAHATVRVSEVLALPQTANFECASTLPAFNPAAAHPGLPGFWQGSAEAWSAGRIAASDGEAKIANLPTGTPAADPRGRETRAAQIAPSRGSGAASTAVAFPQSEKLGANAEAAGLVEPGEDVGKSVSGLIAGEARSFPSGEWSAGSNSPQPPGRNGAETNPEPQQVTSGPAATPGVDGSLLPSGAADTQAGPSDPPPIHVAKPGSAVGRSPALPPGSGVEPQAEASDTATVQAAKAGSVTRWSPASPPGGAVEPQAEASDPTSVQAPRPGSATRRSPASPSMVKGAGAVAAAQHGNPIEGQPGTAVQAGANAGLGRDQAAEQGNAGAAGLQASPSRAGSSGPAQSDTFVALDAGSPAPATTWIHAGAHRAEAGFQDPALGWVGVRADLGTGGIHASLVPASADAAQALGSQLAGLNAHLAEHRTPVETVTLAAPEGRGTETGTAQSGDQGMRDGAGQGSEQGKQPGSGGEPGMLASTLNAETRLEGGRLEATPAAVLSGGGHISVMA